MDKVKTKLPRQVVIVALVALASGFGQDLVAPVLPAYLAALGVGAAGIGLIDGLLQGAVNVARLVSGVVSDRLGRRKGLVFLGYALSSAARPLLALTSGFGGVAALRLLDGVGKGTKDAPRDALVADASPGLHGRAFGFHRLVDTAGSVLGPLAASAVLLAFSPSLASYRLIFLLAAVPGAAALLLILLGLKEARPAAPPAASRAPYAALPRGFWILTVGMSVAYLAKVNDALFLLRAADGGVPLAWLPVLFAGFTLVYALLSYPIGVLSDRFGKLPFIIAGWLVLAVVEFGFAWSLPLGGTVALFAAYGLFDALTEGSARALIAEVAPPEAHGTAYAVYSASVGAAVIAGGFGLGWLWGAVSPQAAFQVAAAGSLLGAAVLFLQQGTQGRRV